MNNALFPLFCCQHMRHKLCTQFSFFQIIWQNAMKDGFQYSVLSTIILQVARWLSFKTATTRAMFLFIFMCPYLPVCSASSIDFSPAVNRLFHRNNVARDSKYCSTRHGQVTRHFYKYFPHFHSHKSRFTTKFYRGTLFEIFNVNMFFKWVPTLKSRMTYDLDTRHQHHNS